MHRNEAFNAFISPAKDDFALWRTGVTFLGGIVVYLFWSAILLFGVGVILGGRYGLPDTMRIVEGVELGATPLQMAMLLATFIPMVGAAMLMVILYGRSPMSLFGPRKNFLRYFVIAAAIIIAFNMLYFALVRVFGADDLAPHLPLATWAWNLAWVVPLLLIQITAEELVFRGFLVQQLASRFKSPIWWMVLPSVIFGLGHFDPSIDPILAIALVFSTVIFGIIAVDLTRQTGSLAAAMGLHFANNFVAMLIVATPDKMSGLALFHSSISIHDTDKMLPHVVIGTVVLVVIWLIARRALR